LPEGASGTPTFTGGNVSIFVSQKWMQKGSKQWTTIRRLHGSSQKLIPN
jgi:hypothetical protein